MLKWALSITLVVAGLAVAVVGRIGGDTKLFSTARVAPEEPAARAPGAGENRWSCEEQKPEPLSLRVDGSGHAWGTLETSAGRVRVVVDTGASITTLSSEDARALGLAAHDPKRRRADFQTANGTVRAELDRLTNVKLGHLCVYVLDVAILPRGALRGSLLGMNFMRKMRKVEYGQGRIALYQ